MYKIFQLFFCVTIIESQQFYYPDENGNVYYNNEIRRILTKNLSSQLAPQIAPIASVYPQAFAAPSQQAAFSYEKYVDDVVAKGIAKFSVVFKRMLTKDTYNYDTIVFAPINIAGALSLLLLGSNGKTFQEINNILGFATGVPDIDRKTEIIHAQFARIIDKLQKASGFSLGNHLDFAVAVFVQNNYPIRKVYHDFAMKIYASEVLNLDFRQDPEIAQKTINAWVSDRTNGKIKEVLTEPPSTNSKLIIASALYFKAQWEYPFFDGGTKRRPFFTYGKDKPSNVQVDMMSNGGDFPYYKDPQLQVEILGFPYLGNKTTMYILKPLNSNQEKLRNLENQLTVEHLQRLVASVKYTSAVILFPKMLIDSTVDLKDPLMNMGLNSLFNPKEANLALISPGLKTGLNVDAVINPIKARKSNNDDSVLIFNRFGNTVVNCTESVNLTTCEKTNSTMKVRSAEQSETLDGLRQKLNAHPENFENPGLYADKIIHKIYMEVTETGTEASATTVIGLSKTGSRVTFRAEVPFSFFIWNEETRIIIFYGSVLTPTPNFK